MRRVYRVYRESNSTPLEPIVRSREKLNLVSFRGEENFESKRRTEVQSLHFYRVITQIGVEENEQWI